ncbi:MAG: NAD(P)/FAD-dependent oxidoreductase [Xanthomonadales bacterium]|nr:NAD(P)/FAD-dependent oxidoreductase [Xanthomonadales bacterium]
MKTYDAIVIGAGHNGLTTAFYLAKSRLSTLVLEQRELVGGCAVTEEIDPENAPGCRVSTAAYMASMLRPEVIRDMALGRHGLKMIAADPAVQIALPEGRVLPWWSDEKRTHAELCRFSRRDADSFFKLDRELKSLARYLQPFFLEPPPQTSATGLAGLLEIIRVGRRFRGLNGRAISDLVTFLTGSLEQFLDRYFESDEVKRLVLANNLYGKHGGPRDPGSAMGLLFHLLSGGDDEKQGFSGHVIGGMGSVTQAMAPVSFSVSPAAAADANPPTARGIASAATISSLWVIASVLASKSPSPRSSADSSKTDFLGLVCNRYHVIRSRAPRGCDRGPCFVWIRHHVPRLTCSTRTARKSASVAIEKS